MNPRALPRAARAERRALRRLSLTLLPSPTVPPEKAMGRCVSLCQHSGSTVVVLVFTHDMCVFVSYHCLLFIQCVVVCECVCKH